MRIHFLTEGFKTPNGRAMLFPLVVFRAEMRNAGLDFHYFLEANPSIYDCDVLIVESKYYGWSWKDQSLKILDELSHFRQNVECLIYFDNSDSTGCLQVEVLPIVDIYWKNQLLVNKQEYFKRHYGQRIFTDFYHNEYGVEDKSPYQSNIMADTEHLDKLCVAWHSGLANYSLVGPSLAAVYDRFPAKSLLKFSSNFVAPGGSRNIALQCRMGFGHGRETVSFQRSLIRRLLKNKISTKKLSRKQYFGELSNCHAVLSPFGQGEITLKDFEVFLTGGLLMKPDMKHMETWPNLFEGGKTIVEFNWDIENLIDTLDQVTSSPDRYLDIAIEGQRRYFQATAGPDAAMLFIDHLKSIIGRLPAVSE